MTQRKKVKQEPALSSVRKRIWLLAVGFLLVQIVVLPGAASPFRTPKTVLALIVILVVVGLSIAGQLARGRLTIRWSPLAAVLLCLPLIQIVSALWSSNPRLALVAAMHSLIWIGGALWIATTSAHERLRLIDATAIGAAISGGILIAQAAGLAVFSLAPAGPSGRLNLTGLTGNPADLSMAAVLLLPLLLTAPGSAGRRWVRWTLAVLLTAAAVISQTLTAFVALGMVWATWLFQQRSRRLWIASAAISIDVIAVGLSTGLDTRIHRQLNRIERGDWYLVLSARSDGWTAASEMIRSHPLVGTGASNFTHAYYPSRISWLDRTGSIGRRTELATHFRFAHCDPLQMNAELGIPGLIWIITLVIVAFRSRQRGDPIPPLAMAAFVPFALFHFPTHLAVGLLPLILTLGHVMAADREIVMEPGKWTRRLSTISVVILVLVGTYWQFHSLIINLWRGGLTHALSVIETLDEPQRSQESAAIEAQIRPRIPALDGARPWLWRLVGRAGMARGDDTSAEIAFRNAMGLWPHEEAEFGLGLALAAQDRRLTEQGLDLDDRNRRGEAIMLLSRVCRTNPALLELIDDSDLRQAVAEIVAAADSGGRLRR